MNVTELREKDVQQLQLDLVDLRKQQFSLRMQYNAGQMSDTSLLRKARRDVARIKTVIKQKMDQG